MPLFARKYFGGGVFRSTDHGDTWSEKNNGLIATEVRAIAINASNALFAGTYGIGMFRSTDGGHAWQEINSGLSALYESCLAIDTAGDIFLGADFVNGAGGVFRSTDNGQSWVFARWRLIPVVTSLQEPILAAMSFDGRTTAVTGRQ